MERTAWVLYTMFTLTVLTFPSRVVYKVGSNRKAPPKALTAIFRTPTLLGTNQNQSGLFSQQKKKLRASHPTPHHPTGLKKSTQTSGKKCTLRYPVPCVYVHPGHPGKPAVARNARRRILPTFVNSCALFSTGEGGGGRMLPYSGFSDLDWGPYFFRAA